MAEEAARLSNGSTGLEILAVTNLIIIVDLSAAISSLRIEDSEQRTSNSFDESLVARTHTRARARTHTHNSSSNRDKCNCEITLKAVIGLMMYT
jgi:hypothetical protein